MATGGTGACPLADKELCDQVVGLGKAIPDLMKTNNENSIALQGMPALVKTSNDNALALARIEEKVAPLPEMAREQRVSSERLAAYEEHQKGADVRITALEKAQDDARKFVIASMFAAIMAFVTALIGLTLKK